MVPAAQLLLVPDVPEAQYWPALQLTQAVPAFESPSVKPARHSLDAREPVVAASGHTATWTEWQGCRERLAHYRLTGAGHGWPGVNGTSEAIIGPSTDVILASEEVWSFAQEIFTAR